MNDHISILSVWGRSFPPVDCMNLDYILGMMKCWGGLLLYNWRVEGIYAEFSMTPVTVAYIRLNNSLCPTSLREIENVKTADGFASYTAAHYSVLSEPACLNRVLHLPVYSGQCIVKKKRINCGGLQRMRTLSIWCILCFHFAPVVWLHITDTMLTLRYYNRNTIYIVAVQAKYCISIALFLCSQVQCSYIRT